MPSGTDGEIGNDIYLTKNLVTGHCMQLNLFVFLLRQLSFFIDNLVPDADFSHIMKNTDVINLLLFLLTAPHAVHNLSCILRHPKGMTSGVMVLCFHGAAEHLNQLLT